MNYTASGTLKLRGNSITCSSSRIFIKYSIGDFVFIKQQALKGILEKICIKKHYIDIKYNPDLIKYQDTFNRAWLEPELIPHEEAINLSIAYYEKKLAGLY